MTMANRLESAVTGAGDRVHETAADLTRSTRDLVEQNPALSVAIACGVGVAVGWAVVSLLSPPAPNWWEKHAPEWLEQLRRTGSEELRKYAS